VDFKQLRNFVAVADHRSFTEAASELNLSQPALSVSIKNLERELGAALFTRTRKDVELTALGVQFSVYAHSALRELDKARALVPATDVKRIRTVRFGIDSIVGRILAKNVLAKFAAQYANIRLDIEISTEPQSVAIERVSSGQWDFGVVLGQLPADLPKGLVAETCIRLTTFPHVRKSHPLARKRSVTLSDLSEYKWVMSTKYGADNIPSLFGRAGVKRPIILMRANSFDMVMTLLEEQDLLTVLPSEIVSRFYPNRFVCVPHKDLRFPTEINLLSSTDLELSPPARLLMNAIGEFLTKIV